MNETNRTGIGFLKDQEAFDKSRPSYNKEEILNFLKKNSINLDKKTVVEFGAGSGKFTEILLNQNHPLESITLVEPDQNAVRILEEKFRGIKLINETIEDLDLDEHIKNTDYIFAMQTFHWFNVDKAADKFKSILKAKNGRLCILGRFIDFDSSEAMKKFKQITRIGKGRYESNIDAYCDENIMKIYGICISYI